MSERQFKTPVDRRPLEPNGEFKRVWRRFLALIETLGARQAANVTLGSADGEIGGLTIGASYSQAEVEALRDKTEELGDDVRAIHAALISAGLMKES